MAWAISTSSSGYALVCSPFPARLYALLVTLGARTMLCFM
jgi:hypothetical protein